MFYWLIRGIGLLSMKTAFSLRYEGKENLKCSDVKVLACNHRSYLDPVLLSLAEKRRCTYMAKEELFKNPVFSLLIRSFGAFPVERGKGDRGVIDQAVDKLKSGKNLVIFPEGTRSKDGKVGRGKTGVALIAAKSNAYVVPVGIAYEGKLKFRKKIVVRYGKPIRPEELQISENPAPRELKELKLKIMGAITELVEK